MQFTDMTKVKKKIVKNSEQGILHQLKKKINAGFAAKKGQTIGIANAQAQESYNQISGDSKYSNQPYSQNHESIFYSGGDEGAAIKDKSYTVEKKSSKNMKW
jgi:ribosomal protein S17E